MYTTGRNCIEGTLLNCFWPSSKFWAHMHLLAIWTGLSDLHFSMPELVHGLAYVVLLGAILRAWFSLIIRWMENATKNNSFWKNTDPGTVPLHLRYQNCQTVFYSASNQRKILITNINEYFATDLVYDVVHKFLTLSVVCWAFSAIGRFFWLNKQFSWSWKLLSQC